MKFLFIAAAGLLLVMSTGCAPDRVLDSNQSIEMLKVDPEKAYAAPVFYFCSMDASAVAFLTEKLSDPNPNIRRNAVHLLGKWLITLEAIEPLKTLYFKEADLLIRKSILDAVQILIPSPDQAKAFIRSAIHTERNPTLKDYAEAMLESFDSKRREVIEASGTCAPDAAKFKTMYDAVYRSSGRKGDLDQLLGHSDLDDENALKALRIRILKEKKVEALYNYQKINSTILRHRYTAAGKSRGSQGQRV
jgi:hypothetical protein